MVAENFCYLLSWPITCQENRVDAELNNQYLVSAIGSRKTVNFKCFSWLLGFKNFRAYLFQISIFSCGPSAAQL
jgi:hypothetical protein